MSTDNPSFPRINPSELRIGIVCACFNQKLTDILLERVTTGLTQNGELKELVIERVPGSNEVPSCIDLILQNKLMDSMIGLGVVIKGQTSHHHIVAEAATQSMQTLSLQYHIPVINGIVVTEDLKSAEDRVHGSIDRGSEFAQAALFMGQIKRKWTKT